MTTPPKEKPDMDPEVIWRGKQMVYKLISQDINRSDSASAIQKRHHSIKNFFAKGIPVDVPLDENGHSAILLYMKSLHMNGTQLMIDCGASLGSVDTLGRNALHFVV